MCVWVVVVVGVFLFLFPVSVSPSGNTLQIPQGTASASKGDFLLSSDHLIEIITKLHRTGINHDQFNIDISDE